jgi:nitrile hydratase accessory protein
MYTKFEHYAATTMLGSKDAPPRQNGQILFTHEWEGRAFGLALALSKQGKFEWEDFRQQLIASISQWEEEHAIDDPSWDYYQRWLIALERILIENDLVTKQEIEKQTEEMLQDGK